MHSTTALLAVIALLPGPQMVHAQPQAEAATAEASARLYTTPQERREAGR